MGQIKSTVQDDYYLFPVGSVYYVKFRDPLTRKLLSKKSTGCRNKTIAKQWVKSEWEKRCAKSASSGIIFGDYANLFFTEGCPLEANHKAAGEHFGIQTKRNYRSDLEKYILPDPICVIHIDEITRAACIDLRDRIIEAHGYTRKSQKIYQCFKNVIHTALDKGIIDKDPVHKLTISWTKKGERKALSLSDVIELFNNEYWENSRLRLAILTAALVGLRAGEVRGILWQDIDPDRNRINVVRQFNDLAGEKKPKWEKTRYTIYPQLLKTQLEPLRGHPDERVFALNDQHRGKKNIGGAFGPVSYKVLSGSLDHAIQKLNKKHDEVGKPLIERITLHGLRHSIQTALSGNGVNPELLRATFGWTDSSVQEGYTHRDLYDLTQQKNITETLFAQLGTQE